jgi:GNAT superfamily N-acetyltransferase
MELIKEYETISALITQSLKKGVRTNTAMSREGYEREIRRGTLMAGMTDTGLIILRNRESHIKMNFYINDISCKLKMDDICTADSSAKPIVTEIAYRERDAALKEAVQYLRECGFESILHRVHLTHGTDGGSAAVSTMPVPHKASPTDTAEVMQLMKSCFDDLTGCIPEEDELYADICSGGVTVTDDDTGAAAGLIHFSVSGKSAEIRHLAVRSDMRGKGLSLQLVNSMLSAADGLKVSVWTGEQNTAALSTYRECGFKPDGRQSEVLIYRFK